VGELSEQKPCGILEGNQKIKKLGSNSNETFDSINLKNWMIHFQNLLNGEVCTSQVLVDELLKSEHQLFSSDCSSRLLTSEKLMMKLVAT